MLKSELKAYKCYVFALPGNTGINLSFWPNQLNECDRDNVLLCYRLTRKSKGFLS